jgi:hypothetical protein
MNRFGTKNLVNEHVLGQLPSEKLMKMKWNPLTEEESIEEEDAGISIPVTKLDGTGGDVMHDCPKHVVHEVTSVPGEVVGHSLNKNGDVNYIDVDYGTGKIYKNLPISNFRIVESRSHTHEVREEES